MKSRVSRATSRPEVVGGLGGFAGLFRLDTSRSTATRCCASSTDGVGTKLAIAQAMDKHDTVGIDLVGMVVDDLVVCGAEPLFMQDYVAVGRVVPERVAEIVGGIAAGCELAGCALVGGETAEHPGLMHDDHYDIAGTGVGVVEADELLGPDRVRPGDVVIAPGLVRHPLQRLLAWSATCCCRAPGCGSTPTSTSWRRARRVAAHPDPDLRQGLPVAGRGDRRARLRARHRGWAGRATWPGCCPTPSHRARPRHLGAAAGLRARAGARPRRAGRDGADVQHGRRHGRVLAPEDADRALAVLTARHVPAWVLGEVAAGGDGAVTLRGAHPA